MSRRMTPEERAERAERRKAEERAATKAYVEKLVADWPLPTPRQQAVIRGLLYGVEETYVPSKPSEYELEQRRKQLEREDALKEAQKSALALTACDVCNLQPEVHRIRQANHIDMHDWMPGRADKLLKEPK